MSWQATSWAIRQTVGSSSVKLLLLTFANYADADGCCWPSQEVLAKDTEQSVDTVQRNIKKLVDAGLMRKVPRPQGAGRWDSRTYFLNMPVAEMSKPQSAARSDGPEQSAGVALPDENTVPHDARDHAATSPVTMPQPARSPCRIAVRCKPSLEPSLKSSLEASSSANPKSTGNPVDAKAAKPPKRSVAERQEAFKTGRKGVEVIQNRIARRLGFDGWEILQGLNTTDLEMITTLEERGKLGADVLGLLRARKPPHTNQTGASQ